MKPPAIIIDKTPDNIMDFIDFQERYYWKMTKKQIEKESKHMVALSVLVSNFDIGGWELE